MLVQEEGGTLLNARSDCLVQISALQLTHCVTSPRSISGWGSAPRAVGEQAESGLKWEMLIQWSQSLFYPKIQYCTSGATSSGSKWPSPHIHEGPQISIFDTSPT